MKRTGLFIESSKDIFLNTKSKCVEGLKDFNPTACKIC
jgi:hypothetical protein